MTTQLAFAALLALTALGAWAGTVLVPGVRR